MGKAAGRAGRERRESQGFGLLQMCKNTCLLNGGHCLPNIPYLPFPHSFVTFEEHLSLKWLESALQSNPFHTVYHPRIPERESFYTFHFVLAALTWREQFQLNLCSGSRGGILPWTLSLASPGPPPLGFFFFLPVDYSPVGLRIRWRWVGGLWG